MRFRFLPLGATPHFSLGAATGDSWRGNNRKSQGPHHASLA